MKKENDKLKKEIDDSQLEKISGGVIRKPVPRAQPQPATPKPPRPLQKTGP